MASPADSSGRNAPRTCLIQMDPALAPALFLMVATSAVETVLSAVTTTRSAAPSTYHARPRIPDCSTAWRAVESWPLLLWRVAAEAAAARMHTEIAASAMATASNWAALVAGRRAGRGFTTTGPPLLDTVTSSRGSEPDVGAALAEPDGLGFRPLRLARAR